MGQIWRGARGALLAVTTAGVIAAGAAVWNAVAAGAGTTGSAVVGSETSAAIHPAANPGAVTDAAALGDLGRLAWVKGDGLALYLGPDQPLREVTVNGSITQLAWSPHGERLAFLIEQGDDQNLGWVSAGGGAANAADGAANAAEGAVHVIAGLPGPVGSFAWLADGSGWVVSVTLPAKEPTQRSDAVYMVPVGSGEVRQLLVASGDGLRLAGPVSATGRFAYWRDPLHSASLAADGLPLFVAEVGSGDNGLPVSKSLSTTLPYPGWVRWSPDGTRLLVVAGSGRDARRGKRLARCDAVAATCTELLQPPGSVSLDPAFSPDGTRIAFIRASAVGDGVTGGAFGDSGGGDGSGDSGGSGGNVGAASSGWAASRTLVVARPDGSDVHPLSNAGTGVEAPLWADRSHLLYWRIGELWLLAVDDAGASPIRVLSGEPNARVAYFGYADPWASSAWQVRP